MILSKQMREWLTSDGLKLYNKAKQVNNLTHTVLDQSLGTLCKGGG